MHTTTAIRLFIAPRELLFTQKQANASISNKKLIVFGAPKFPWKGIRRLLQASSAALTIEEAAARANKAELVLRAD